MPRNAPASTVAVHPLKATDLVAMARCVAIDVGSFPYPSTRFVLRPDGSPVWVARDAGESRILGFLAASERHGRDLYIEGLAVDAGARRRGVGRALVRAAIRFAGRRRAREVALHVWTGNLAAVDLYRSEGFDVQQHAPHFYRPGSFETLDAYRMARAIDADAG